MVDHYKDAYESKMVAYKSSSVGRQNYEIKNGDKIKSGNLFYKMGLWGFKADEKRRKVEMEAAKTDLEAAKKHLKKIEETSQTIGKIQSDMGSLGSITGSWMQMTEGSVVNGQSSKAYKVASGANAAVAVAQDMLKAADSFNNGDIAGGAAAMAQAMGEASGIIRDNTAHRAERRVSESNTAGTLATSIGKRVNKYGAYTSIQDFVASYEKNNVGSFKNVNNVIKGISENDGQGIINSMANENSKEALRKEGFDKTKNISALGAQYAAMVKQRDLLQSAANSEKYGKSGDAQRASDYEAQAAELNDQINEFKSNVLKEIYGIDLTSFSNSLSSALVDAFKNGQDAAEAFANSVNNLLDTIVKNVISQAIIMPEVEKLMKQIEDTYDLNDPDSIDNVIDIISEWSDKIGTKIVENGEKIYKGVDNRTGGKLSANGSSSSMSSSIKGLTEETGSLLASYINAIRADVSMSRDMLKQVVEVAFPQMNVLAEQQLKQLNAIVQQAKLIEANTRSNAEAAKNIQSALNSVLTLGNGGKAVRIKT